MVYVTDQDGIVVFDSDQGKAVGADYSRWNDVFRTLRGGYGARTTRTDPADVNSSVLYVAAPVRIGDRIAGVLTVSKPSDSITQFWRLARRKLIGAGVIAAVVVAGLGMLFSSWITRPIQKLTDYANAVRDGQRTALPRLGNSEIGQLGSAFEQMRDALEGKDYIDHYVQTLTHEMKSPLSAILGATALLKEDDMPAGHRRRFLENIGTESARIQSLVDRLLQLAALEKRKGLCDVENIVLSETIDDVLAAMHPALEARQLVIQREGPAALVVRGERFLLRQAISNILQNALEFSPAGGTIQLCVREAGDCVEITILDEGPGIPPYALGKVFDRFYSLIRPDTGRKSSGIGLTFVHEVAVLHGGWVTVGNREQGGAAVVLSIPSRLG
jgi:two-component system sensor histidine kinase CreC